MPLEISPFVITCPQNAQSAPGTFLKMTANRYSTPESHADTRGLTLVFGHGPGAHKEQWSATIEELFPLQPSRYPHSRVYEAWSLDCMNHGDAALLNREELSSNRKDAPFEWAEAIAAFLRSPQMEGKRIVLLAHSAGAMAVALSTKTTRRDQPLPCVGIIFVEPFMMTADVYYLHLDKDIQQLVLRTESRRDKWPSREVAYPFFKVRHPYDVFSPRVFNAWMMHGLVDTPDGGVTLKCNKSQEAQCYRYFIDGLTASFDQIAHVCLKIPVYIIWGTRVDPLVPQAARDLVSWIPSSNRVQGGHPLPQENPAGVAVEICRVLDTFSSVWIRESQITSRL
ncbi:Alpha/Beta hydrolase protein [Mycena metata]|uniref:Alpha/Beta hydrolase protein n=1 Tax=Mycena metata TaxID=1033252 RepID=A0AAD7NRZ8_9AGAR|nr:Alpha/Beta hydrolase protein [Mycena metata]